MDKFIITMNKLNKSLFALIILLAITTMCIHGVYIINTAWDNSVSESVCIDSYTSKGIARDLITTHNGTCSINYKG